jgi:hypothetical protein
MTITEDPGPIGHFYKIGVRGKCLLANCIDADSDGKPKRMRIQTKGTHAGQVVMPSEYIIFEKDPTDG